jgi:hypothetical protein
VHHKYDTLIYLSKTFQQYQEHTPNFLEIKKKFKSIEFLIMKILKIQCLLNFHSKHYKFILLHSYLLRALQLPRTQLKPWCERSQCDKTNKIQKLP